MSTPPLNEPQRKAVFHGDGPLLVLAGPGSGKTRVVTHRIAHLLERGVAAENVLAVTFTNKAAREMRDRVRRLVPSAKRSSGLVIATFHSACVRVLREEIGALGYGRNFSIYDASSQQSLMRGILRDLRGNSSSRGAQEALAGLGVVRQAHGGSADRSAAPGPDVPLDPGQEEERALLEGVRDRYERELRARNAVDFDDLILLTARLFREAPEVLARWQERWRHLLVDEYQDTNATQDEVLRLLSGARRNLCVVGDDDQSIYGWRGAEVEHILTFPRRFPGAVVVRLEQNYRSTGHVVAVANAIIEKSAHRHEKTVFTRRPPGESVRVVDLPEENEEADFIATEIASALVPGDDPWRSAARFAVLFRTNEQMRPIEQALRIAKIPYKLLGGRSFFDRKEVLDVLAYVRVAVNPDDEEALFRIVNVPARGLGPGAIEAISRAASSLRKRPWDVLAAVASGERLVPDLAAKQVAGVERLVAALAAFGHAASLRVTDAVKDLVEAIGYREEVARSYADEGVRQARYNLALEVQAAWAAYLQEAGGKATLPGFLDSITLRHRDDDQDSGGGVTLATVHASKGLEFPVVFVAGCEEGILPHSRSVDDPRALEEERRLFYVAATRAQERLYLTRAAARTTRGRSSPRVPSRFLDALPADSVELGLSDAPAAAPRVESSLARLRSIVELPDPAPAEAENRPRGDFPAPPPPATAPPPAPATWREREEDGSVKPKESELGPLFR